MQRDCLHVIKVLSQCYVIVTDKRHCNKIEMIIIIEINVARIISLVMSGVLDLEEYNIINNW